METTQIDSPITINDNNDAVNSDKLHVASTNSFDDIDDIDLDSYLLQIPLNLYGALLSFYNTILFIPDRLLKQVRDVYCKVLEDLLSSINNVIYWKRFLLLPVILLSNKDREIMKLHLDKVKNNLWEFKVRDFINYDSLLPSRKQSKHSYPSKCIANGQLSKAMNVISRSRVSFDPSSMPVKQLLEEKHPQHNYPITEEEMEILRSFKVQEEHKIFVDGMEIRRIIQNSKKMIRPGLDKLRYEHLKALVGRNVEPSASEIRFTTLFGELVAVILNGDIPESVACVIRDNELIAIPKSDSDIRPIGIGSTIRKVASMVAFNRLREFNKKYFSKFQYGSNKNGGERIIHDIRFRRDQHPSHDFYAIDGVNAFNNANRLIGLQQVLSKTPQVFAFVREMYLSSSNGWYYGPDMTYPIKSVNGFHQGDFGILVVYPYNISVITKH